MIKTTTKEELIQTAKEIATAQGLEGFLVCAIIEQESSWNTYALRSESESGFATRYGAAYQKIVAASASKNDDTWLKFEDIFYCSYGLMQTMYPVIIENFPEQIALLKFPTSLCEPVTGITQGCRLFAKKLKQANGDVNKALLNWNGGGDPNYDKKVLARIDTYK